MYDRKDLAELLIAKGAQVNAKSEYDDTPLHLAVFIGHEDMAEFLITAGAGVNAKTEGVYTIAVNKNTWRPVCGGTPLHLAASKGNGQIVKLLIAKGADINIKDREGATPLNAAVRLKQNDIAELLRKHGATEK